MTPLSWDVREQSNVLRASARGRAARRNGGEHRPSSWLPPPPPRAPAPCKLQGHQFTSRKLQVAATSNESVLVTFAACNCRSLCRARLRSRAYGYTRLFSRAFSTSSGRCSARSSSSGAEKAPVQILILSVQILILSVHSTLALAPAAPRRRLYRY